MTFNRISAILIDSLNVDENQIVLSASLSKDLGAESIDLLDIVFRLEREFNIKIDSYELFPTAIFSGDDGYLMPDGFITPKGIAKLKETIPHGDFSKLSNNPKQDEISSIFTVETLVKYVDSKMPLAA